VFALLFALLAAAVALTLGRAPISVGDVLKALVGSDVATDVHAIVRQDRLPRVLLGLGVGAALATAGVLLQALLRNPLADPYVVGVGPGALLGAAIGGALGLGSTTVLGLSGAGACAFAGAALATALVLGIARGEGAAGGFAGGSSARLVLAGVAVGSFATAIATWTLYVEDPSWQQAIQWLLGTLAWADGARVGLAGGAAVLLLAFAWTRARELDALAMGEESARHVGVDVARAVPLLAGVACLLTAATVATAGLVSFVGLVVPHLARRLVGPGHRLLLPTAAALGAGLLVLADGVARRAASVEIPVGVVTALVGAPVFALLVIRSRR
jgi:iron complex transport system permease protein